MSYKEHRVELISADGGQVVLHVSERESIWDGALRSGLELPSTCLQGWCLTCAGRVLEGDFDPSEALRYYADDREEGFILLCTARPLSEMKILIHQKEAMQRHRASHGLPWPRG